MSMMSWLPLLLIILGRVVWQIWPGLATCLLFWAIVWGDRATDTYWAHNPAGWVAITGVACNCAVTLANRGMMPCLNYQGRFLSVWREAQPGDHLLWLCDRFWGFSVGDFLILGGLLAQIIWDLRH